MQKDVILTSSSFDEAVEYKKFAMANRYAGAIISFCGHVRDQGEAGKVSSLYLDWYPGMSERSLQNIADDAEARFDLLALKIIHRCEQVGAGEPIVLVMAASLHRREAFNGVDYMMDRLKSEAGLWKREVGDGNGEGKWIEPKPSDATDLARWEIKS